MAHRLVPFSILEVPGCNLFWSPLIQTEKLHDLPSSLQANEEGITANYAKCHTASHR